MLASMLLIAACAAEDDEAGPDVGTAPSDSVTAPEAYQLQQAVATGFNVTTTSLKETGFLQTEFTCEGSDSSPHIAWDDVPSGTQSVVVVAEDLDLAGASLALACVGPVAGYAGAAGGGVWLDRHQVHIEEADNVTVGVPLSDQRGVS